MTADLSSKRVLLLGAETDTGRAVASALAETGARLALVGASNDAETAFAVQRLARKLKAEVSQAIDGTSDMAVRIMVRQVWKALGSFDAVVYSAADHRGSVYFQEFASRAFQRSDTRGVFVFCEPDVDRPEELDLAARKPNPKFYMGIFQPVTKDRSAQVIATDVVDALATRWDSK